MPKNTKQKNLGELESRSNAVDINDLSKTFQDNTPVLDNFRLQVPHNEFLCVLGPSGCGKSTLLRLIAGLETPTSGRISVSPSPASNLSTLPEPDQSSSKLPATSSHRQDHQLAYVFQHPNLLPWRSVESNIGLPLELKGIRQRLIRQTVGQTLKQVGLNPEDAKKLPGMLSGGMQMRASLARAIVTEPRILLLDEPFGALDEVLRHRLNEELFRWAKEKNWTVIFVTHSVSEAVFLGTRTILMGNQGKIVFQKESPFNCDRKSNLRNTPEFHLLSEELSTKLRELTPETDR